MIDTNHVNTQQKDRNFTSVWLRKNEALPHIFFCNTCQYPLFKYQGVVVMIVPGDASLNGENTSVMKFPVTIQCRGRSDKYGKCVAIYVVEGFAI